MKKKNEEEWYYLLKIPRAPQGKPLSKFKLLRTLNLRLFGDILQSEEYCWLSIRKERTQLALI